jgi:hypothetical protein
MELKSNSIVVILVDAAWASGVNVEAWLGPAKDTSPPHAKAYAVRIRDTTLQFGLLVQAIYGDQPEGNETRLLIPWRSLEAIVWRPNMEKMPGPVGFTRQQT